MQLHSESRQQRLLNWISSSEREPEYRNAWWMLQEQIEADRAWSSQALWWQFLRRLSLPGAALIVHRYAL